MKLQQRTTALERTAAEAIPRGCSLIYFTGQIIALNSGVVKHTISSAHV